MASIVSMPGFLLVSIALAAVLVYLPFLAVGYGRFAAGYDKSAPRSHAGQVATLCSASYLGP